MNKKLQIEHLARLLHVEVHMVSAYDGATTRMAEEDRVGALESLRGDHERHVLDITELLREMGEPSPEPSPDVEGLFATGMAALKHADSDDDVIQAVRINEQVVAGEYVQAREWGVGLQVHELLARNDADEQRHLAAVADMLGAPAGRRRG